MFRDIDADRADAVTPFLMYDLDREGYREEAGSDRYARVDRRWITSVLLILCSDDKPQWYVPDKTSSIICRKHTSLFLTSRSQHN